MRKDEQDPGTEDRAPSPSLPWALAPLPLSDEKSGPKVLLTWEGEGSLEEEEGKAAQRSQRLRRRPRLQSCRLGSLRSFTVRPPGAQLGQRVVHPFGAVQEGRCGRQAGSPVPAPRAGGGGGGGGGDGYAILSRTPLRVPAEGPAFSPVHPLSLPAFLALASAPPAPYLLLLCGFLRFTLLSPTPHLAPQQVGTLGDAVPTEQLQGERERGREGEGDAGGDGLGSSLSLAVPPGPLSFEALLAQVGALGGGQQLQLGLCCLPVLFVALGLASDPIFTLAPPLHCHYGAFPPNASGWEQPPNASGVSVASAALAASAVSRVATSTDPSCSGFAPPDFNHCLKDWDYNGLPVLTTNAIGQWDLVCDLGWQVILEQILFILGFASGYLFLGYPADRFGRRGIVLLTLGLVGPCGVGGAAAGSSTGVMALRFLLGFLLAGVDLGVYLMRLELCDPTQRLRVALAGELVGVGGHFLFLGLALVSKDWRFLQRMITAPCILFLFYGLATESGSLHPQRIGTQSSPLRSNVGWWDGGRPDQTKTSDVPPTITSPSNSFELDTTPRTDSPWPGYPSTTPFFGFSETFHSSHLENTCPLPATSTFSLASLLNYRNIWKNLLILGFTNFIAHAIRHCYQPVGGGGSPSDFYLCSLLASGTAALACVFLGVTVDRFGRRGILLLAMTLTGIASLVLLGLWDYLNEAAITTFSVLGLFSSQAAAILSTLLAAEVIPTTVRGRGLGLIMALGALGGLSGPAQRLHMGHGAFLQHVVLAACALLCILSIMLLPETKRKLLPEVLRDGELCRRPSLLRQPPPNRCDHVPLLATPNPAL
ncbi:Hypothetical predicted protein [Marmota monax]|uniref:Major facilitator superfamily (MFS) profile domain-containing protein n=1 Tax=Marmota monax TaxID=9995 RepID=A0A5E4BB92_MARMO|nr:Hypothetical predicted protein [Marmota monax]